jgi:poly(A) polymerase Pap1
MGTHVGSRREGEVMKTKDEPGNDEIVFCAGILAGMISQANGDTFKQYLEDVYTWMLEITGYCSVEEYYEKKFGLVECDALIRELTERRIEAITPNVLSELTKAFDTVRARVREEELPK